jgi:hypothetical protein
MGAQDMGKAIYSPEIFLNITFRLAILEIALFWKKNEYVSYR